MSTAARAFRSLDVLTLRMRVNRFVRELHQTRDLIFWDQRGVGYSEPHLCTTLDTGWFQVTERGATAEAERSDVVADLRACADELRRAGWNVTQRRALGIERWALWGGSYGTRVSLEYLRDHTDHIDGALLDGVSPPNASDTLAQAPRLAKAIDHLNNSEPAFSFHFNYLSQKRLQSGGLSKRHWG